MAAFGGGHANAPTIVHGDLRLIWVTDTHIETHAFEPRDSSITGALTDANTWGADAVVHTGDIGDNLIDNVRRGFSLLRGTLISCPLIAVIGNHDEEEITNPGVPNTSQIEASDCFNHTAPEYGTMQLSAQNGNLKARLIWLDCNYNGEVTPNHPTIGERIGHHTQAAFAGYNRQLGATQRAWIASTLAADTTSHIVLVFVHYPIDATLVDSPQLADILLADKRPNALFCGHVHPGTSIYYQYGATNSKRVTQYRMAAGLESGAWCRLRVGHAPDGVKIVEASIKNYTNPGGWTVSAPFQVVP